MRNRDYSDKDMMGGKGYGPAKSPGNGRGPNSVMMKNPAPMPERGGFDAGMMNQPDRVKAMKMMKEEYNRRESGRGKGSI